MGYRVGHLALFVSDLRAGEAFYQRTFDMEVLFREAEMDDGTWHTLRPGTDWDDAAEAGVEIRMVALQRDGFTLPIFVGRPQPGTVLEIGVAVPLEEIEGISARLPDSATRLRQECGDLIFEDPFGFRWHIDGSDEGFLSNGEIAGRWLDI